MFAWIELPREAVQQWRTNVLARRVWRRIWWKAVLVAVPASLLSSQLVWLSTSLLGALGFARAGGLAYTILYGFSFAMIGVLLHPILVVAIGLARWCYRFTFLSDVHLQALPLTPRDRLWGMALPLALALGAIVLAAPLLRDLVVVARILVQAIAPQATLGEKAATIAAIIVHRTLWGTMLLAYFSVVGLRATMRHGQPTGQRARYVAVPILWQLAMAGMLFPTVQYTAMMLIYWLLPSPNPYLVGNVIAASGALLIVPIHLPILCVLLRRTMREAERDLFTPEAVERWEQKR